MTRPLGFDTKIYYIYRFVFQSCSLALSDTEPLETALDIETWTHTDSPRFMGETCRRHTSRTIYNIEPLKPDILAHILDTCIPLGLSSFLGVNLIPLAVGRCGS